MKIETAIPKVGFTRCAVCKINLKGRFVYVDEKTEKLLGCSSEELFGKSLFDFLDDPSIELIESLLMQRNHYETFYDSSYITLITANADRVAAEVVASLNFNAGNPVNFQLIFVPREQFCEQVAVSDDSAVKLIQAVSQNDKLFGWKQSLDILRNYCGAKQISVYLSSGESLKPRAGVSEIKNGDFDFQDIPEAGPLHNYCARVDYEYDFTDKDSVARAIEESGSAPNEFITRLTLSESESYLITIAFAEHVSGALAKSAVVKARLGIGVITNLLKLGLASSDSDQENYDVKFTIGFLDALGIGAALIQSDGQVSGYNSSLVNIAALENFEGNCLDMASAIANDSTALISLVDQFYSSELSDDDYQDFSVEVTLPTDEEAKMVITRFSYDASDRSSAIVLIPSSIVTGKKSGSADNMSPIWGQFCARLEGDLKNILETTEDFGHRYFDESNSEAANNLEQLLDLVSSTTTKYKNTSMLLPLIKRAPIEKITDLNLLLKRISSKIKSDYPKIKINQHLSKIEKVTTDSEKAEALLTYLSEFAAEKIKEADNFLHLTSTAEKNLIRLIIDNDAIQGACASFKPDLELSIAQSLAADLGWQIDCESDNKAGFRATVTISLS